MARSALHLRPHAGFTLSLLASLLLAAPLLASDSERERESKTSASETSSAAEAARKSPARETPQQQESPLVRAAREGLKTTGTRKFTDEDLRDVRGRLIVIEGSNVQATEVESVEARLARLRKQQQQQPPQQQGPSRERQIAALEQTIEALEEQLLEIEESAYLEGAYLADEDFERTSEDSRFAVKRAELERARRELARLTSSRNE
jgi:tRNA U34 5-carboxymethylaminomethyl modifying GTPase MnmE/TrmE